MAAPDDGTPAQRERRDALLRLTLTPGFGPVLIRRAVGVLGSPQRVLAASPAQLETIPGVGPARARALCDRRAEGDRALLDERALADRLGVRIVTILDGEYPPLLAQLENAPPVLYVRGSLDPAQDQHACAIVGSRGCTAYGVEQAERFATMLAQAGLTIVSGGARGIDSAAHRGALRGRGRTIVVMGCGLAHCYPPENRELFDEIVASGGAVVSELPLATSPSADNFPARNRIISGIGLGVLVIEAGRGSGALITARLAAEEHGREVMVVPGRVDSPSSEGSLDLLKSGGGAVVTTPGDVIEILEGPARQLFEGVHAEFRRDLPGAESGLFGGGDGAARPPDPRASAAPAPALGNLTVSQRTLVEALAEPRTFDDLARHTGLDPAVLRADATVLEIRRVIIRDGSRLARARDRQPGPDRRTQGK